MRIALVYDALYPETKGGVERRVWEIAQRLAAWGHSVELLVPKSWEGMNTVRRSGVTIHGVCRPRPLYRKSGRRALIPSLLHAYGVYRRLRDEPYDVVDVQIPAHPALIAAQLVRRRRRETMLVATWHEVWGHYWVDEFGLLGTLGRFAERWSARAAVAHVAISTSTAEFLQQLGTEPVATIEAGVDLDAIDPVEPLYRGEIAVLGRLVPSKNVRLALEAMALMVAAGQRRHLVVIGDGPDRADLEELVRESGLNDLVRFEGEISDWLEVVGTLKGSKVLALPSVREGFGLVALEAAACGVPVVTVDHPRNAARMLVESGRTGIVVDNDPGLFADALTKLLEDETLRGAMSRSSRQMVSGYQWEETAAAALLQYENGSTAPPSDGVGQPAELSFNA